MILRVFIVTIHDGKVAEFEDFFRTIAIPLVKNWPGLMSMHTANPNPRTLTNSA